MWSRFAVVLLSLTLAARAQAPVERRPPLAAWPAPMTSRTGLIVATRDGLESFCAKPGFEAYRLNCAGPQGPHSWVVDREEVQWIAIAPRHYHSLDGVPKALAIGGATILFIGGACGADGGPVCKAPVIAGLSLLASSIAVKIAQAHHHPQPLKLIYQASY